MKEIAYLIIIAGLVGCNGQPGNNQTSVDKELEPVPVAWSLSGDPFYEPSRSTEQQAKLEAHLDAAQEDFDNEDTEINYIWLGRRLAYMSRYPEAIEVYTKGLEKYPDSYRLYRHRGHRYISVRKFDKAVADFKMAAELMPKDTIEIEADGIPNKLNQPLSSTQFNVWYHLGLAYYLKGEYDKAAEAYLKCMEVSTSDDLLVATSDWLYMTYLRLDRRDMADSLLSSIPESLSIIENDSYYQRLKMYAGELTPDELLSVDSTQIDYDLALVTQGYGVANFYLSKGDSANGIQILDQVLNGNYWSAFGYIAAEADHHRLKE